MAGIEDFFEENVDETPVDNDGDAGKTSGDVTPDDGGKSGDDGPTEGSKTGDDGAGDVGDKGKPNADDATGDADPKSDADPKTGDGQKTGGKSDSEDGNKNADEAHQEEINNLRTMLRDQSRQLKDQTGRSQELTKKLIDAGLITEDELPTADSGNDALIAKQLDLLAETMRVNPKYANFDEVLDESNWDATVEAMAKLVVAEDGGTLSDRVLDVERYVWEQANPYLYMYEVITSNMDKFKKEAPDSGTSGKEKKKDKAPIAPSLGSMSAGSGKDTGGWTAVKIDGMDENDLHTVPNDVYKRYMANELD